MSKGSVLFILSSADKTLDGKPIGWYLPEAAHPYHALSNDFEIVGASPKGGQAPVDQNSVENLMDDQGRFFLDDKKAQKVWKETIKISEVKASDFKAIFVVGGHGPMIDLAFDKEFAKLVEEFYNAKKPVSAVCHGPAALVLAKRSDGKSILEGVAVTGFSNAEEAQTPYNDFEKILPFSLEDKLNQLGGKYETGGDWQPKVCWEGGVLTGQNPQSAAPLGDKLREILLA